nr:ATP-dependent RNA helicase-like protein DB10 [Rhipicephalus microplus]
MTRLEGGTCKWPADSSSNPGQCCYTGGKAYSPLQLAEQQLALQPGTFQRVSQQCHMAMDCVITLAQEPPRAQCWPVALSGRDLVVIDCTTFKWKSLALLVPAVTHAQHQWSVLEDGGTTVLVLTVTLELALQFRTLVQKFSKGFRTRTMYLLSCKPKNPQLEEGVDICVVTADHLRAFIEQRKVDLGRCRSLAIDEADRTLEMGFGINIRAVVE